MYYLGIDVGSITTKAVLIDERMQIISSHLVRTGATVKKAIQSVCDAVTLQSTRVYHETACIVSTGYGRKAVERAHKSVTEITAHAHSARFFYPDTRLIIDIGGQDTKVIGLTEDGAVDDFVMNDKCAAGTGRVLEVMAHILDIPIHLFGETALRHTKNISINNTCTVFAESEVISLIAREERIEDIAYAIHASVTDRIISLASKIPFHGTIVLTGGVSHNHAIQWSIKERLDSTIHVPSNPQIMGAFGAALLAHKSVTAPSIA